MSSSSTKLTLVPDFEPPKIPGLSYVRYLGSGTWGHVHLYQNEVNGALHACKFLNLEGVEPKEFMKKRRLSLEDVLRKESLHGNSSSLPNLAYVTLEKDANGGFYLREEYIDRFLADRLEEGNVGVKETVGIAKGMAKSLESLHSLGHVHGDFHPGNIGYTLDGVVKGADFGTATIGLNERKYVGHISVRAPEKFLERESSQSSDVWAFGSNLYKRFPVIKEKKDELAFTLSGGQQQMLALGRALVRKPLVLLLDEPSLGLSPFLQKELFENICKLRDEGLAILIVEQNAKKAIEIADRTYLLESGNVALEGGKEIIHNPKIKNIYLGGKY